ncbi:2-phosphosulfolactate phosphatase [Mycetocola spongiae]|uniref:2-phosphosulfolactate phosphatase n=1 Tax=Mycetocola spongiae TaxID=2859226 RepID=UPI001CF37FAE|nr:2-phosphosulfolactate phosphatase [Mycetocola spongiae]UCR88536.1 2-phosphosulfolactate phosphatase [Mycetocola spongiae]
MNQSSAPEISPPSQGRYQVRFDFGPEGLRRLGDVDILVWVDSLPEAGSIPALDGLGDHTAIILGSLNSRTAVAEWILGRQVALGRRLTVALVGAGFEGGFATHDFLAAGAIADALAERGIDFTSPEAAVAAAAFAGLRGATGHLFTASIVGQLVRNRLSAEPVKAASQIDTQTEVVVLREGAEA